MSRGAIYDLMANAHPISALAAEGRVFYYGDADQNDLVTGQTSFADTTPTFLLSNPAGSGVYIGVLRIFLAQTGTVAGDIVNVIVEIDNTNRHSSGGTAELPFCSRTDSPLGAVAADGTGANKGILRSGATASAGMGQRIDAGIAGPDVSPAEGAFNPYVYEPSSGIDWLAPGSSCLVYAYAGTTGPTLIWGFKTVEVPAGLMGF